MQLGNLLTSTYPISQKIRALDWLWAFGHWTWGPVRFLWEPEVCHIYKLVFKLVRIPSAQRKKSYDAAAKRSCIVDNVEETFLLLYYSSFFWSVLLPVQDTLLFLTT